jgi:Effector-associated domain 11/Putative ATP-dependent DNA helicase recG C-terminal
MSSTSIIETIRSYIASGNMDEVFFLLKKLLETSPKLDEALHQSGRFHDIRKQIRLGVVSMESASLTQNQIQVGVLELLREIEDQSEKLTIKKEIKSALEAQIDTSEYDIFRKDVQKYEHNQSSSTSTPLIGKTTEQLDKKALKNLFAQPRTQSHLQIHLVKKQATNTDKLKALHLMSNGYVLKGTFLCLSTVEQIRSVSSNAYLSKFFAFADNQGLRTVITEFVSGNLISQFEQMISHIKRNLYLVRNVETRTEDYEIPEIAFTELLANAFIHRNYADHIITDVKVEIYPDRMEITNPGQFSEEIDLERMEQNSKSFIHNPEIVQTFFLHKYAETAAKGIVRSQAALKAMGMLPAVFEQKKGYVKVVLFKKALIHYWEKQVG